MEDKLNKLLEETENRLKNVTTVAEFENLWLAIFGKSGQFTIVAKDIRLLPDTEKPLAGKLINSAKTKLDGSFAATKKRLISSQERETVDFTMPAVKPPLGHLHIVTTAVEEITRIFEKIGFTRESYPEVEWDYYAFGSLNFPENHPARDDFETFYIEEQQSPKYGRMLLTPHTSSGQVREMERRKSPPIRMINISKCYRQNWDVSHTPMFHQFEGLVVDKGISIIHLKGTLDYFARHFFGKNRKTRLRPFHFQFTEPSFEVDIICGICNGTGIISSAEKCRFCKDGWLELGGAGMVHPNVLRAGNIDPDKYSGFAFGWGVERTYMMKSGTRLDDLRLLYSNDLRFLEQF